MSNTKIRQLIILCSFIIVILIFISTAYIMGIKYIEEQKNISKDTSHILSFIFGSLVFFLIEFLRNSLSKISLEQKSLEQNSIEPSQASQDVFSNNIFKRQQNSPGLKRVS